MVFLFPVRAEPRVLYARETTRMQPVRKEKLQKTLREGKKTWDDTDSFGTHFEAKCFWAVHIGSAGNLRFQEFLIGVRHAGSAR